MRQSLGADAEEVLKELAKHGLPRGLAKQAVEMVADGRFTIFALVDALTRLARRWITPATGPTWTKGGPALATRPRRVTPLPGPD